MVRDDISAALNGAAVVGNKVLRVMADANGGLAHLALRYLDWQARQYLPDTAEQEWLDRHGDIWLRNSDGSKGRKVAALASGTVTLTGVRGAVVPIGTLLTSGAVDYETTSQITIGSAATPVAVRALTGGAQGNLDAGVGIALGEQITDVDSSATVVTMTGGADEEQQENLRSRVLERLQNPPMGGDQEDYVLWTLGVPGVTRAWCYPLEMGIGTVTVRFLCDDLRSDNDGIPNQFDIDRVTTWLNQKRPVAVKDFFVEAPIKQEIEFTITDLETDTEDVRAAIEESVRAMLFKRAEPGQMIYHSWVAEAIAQALGEDHHTLTFSNTAMQSPGHIAVLGSIIYG